MMCMARKASQKPPTKKEAKFTKDQLLRSAAYSHRRDALCNLLEDGGMYSHAEIAAKLKQFFERTVK